MTNLLSAWASTNMCVIEFDESVSEDQIKLIENSIQSAALIINSVLPLDSVRVKIQMDEKWAIPEHGVGGWCFNESEINIALIPNRESDWLGSTVLTRDKF